MLELKHISYTIQGKTILNDVSVALKDHEITCLIGPNGVGKSTILNLITAHVKMTAGTVKCVPRKVALLAQYNELFEPLTVRELITLTGYSLDEEVLELLQLRELLDQGMHDLSGGQRQLAWLGYVLHQEPELLLLDEPTTYLDLKYQQVFLNALTTLQKKRQFTVLMVLHDLTQAVNVSQNMWLLTNEHELLTGETNEMLDQHLLSKTFGVSLRIFKDSNGHLIIPCP